MKAGRPDLRRGVGIAGFLLATAGLTVLAWDNVVYDQWAVFGAGVATLAALLALAVTGWGTLWLGVAGAWTYATVVEAFRGPDTIERAGVALLFSSFAVMALGAYTVWRAERRQRKAAG